MTTAIVHIPSPVLAPRGAALAANVMASVLAWLEAVGTARAAAHARRDQATRIAEAAATRRYAQQWIERDPRFAADLLAAADRHDWAD
jgi:hypothetical protein